ncbi:MAG: non-canonical purine NTP pyrophosphatase [Candidatus Aenigmarchaeota archaeon ex4484_14]|nr:MAG: non-canonical purine NTP pyrophosphatase [Candidatus Aenigmarchaeota archaeon ex4484_14]
MKHHLFFVTGNAGKVRSLNNILKELKSNVVVEQLKYNYPEIKDDEKIETVALLGASYCYKKFGKGVIVTDVGLFIDALNGFPGINTSFVLKKIGTIGLIKLMKGVKNRSVDFRLALGYAGKKGSKVFSASVSGKVAQRPAGRGGFGFDPIFILDGQKKTFAQDPSLRDRYGPFRMCVKKFIRWYDK